MANKKQIKILKKSVKMWNKWRESDPTLIINLKGADLHNTNLSYADLSYAKLSNADLHGADLSRANLRYAYLSGADLGEVIFDSSNLCDANLCNANFSGADLSGVNFDSANLNGANFEYAIIGRTIFGAVDLSKTHGLGDTRHWSPSTICIDTVYHSKGNIPLTFLKGAGVPDGFIEYMHSLTGSAFDYYSCFISYSTKDQDFAERLYADLQSKGVRCWFAPENIEGGKKIYDQITEAIRIHEKLLLVLSENSMSSEWVKTEIRKAKEREEREHLQKFFPIAITPFQNIKNWKLFDSDRGTDLAVFIRSYFVPDFSEWKNHEKYQKAFNRLLRDLKADKPRSQVNDQLTQADETN